MSLLGQTEAVVDHLQPLTAGKEAGQQSMAVFNRGVGKKGFSNRCESPQPQEGLEHTVTNVHKRYEAD